jgi:hypothetical protein
VTPCPDKGGGQCTTAVAGSIEEILRKSESSTCKFTTSKCLLMLWDFHIGVGSHRESRETPKKILSHGSNWVSQEKMKIEKNWEDAPLLGCNPRAEHYPKTFPFPP